MKGQGQRSNTRRSSNWKSQVFRPPALTLRHPSWQATSSVRPRNLPITESLSSYPRFTRSLANYRGSPKKIFLKRKGKKMSVKERLLKSRVGNIIAKASALRVNLNLDGTPIASSCHTYPSHSQTSRLLTSSLSLGVPVPRPTQCMGGV